MKLYIGVVYL